MDNLVLWAVVAVVICTATFRVTEGDQCQGSPCNPNQCKNGGTCVLNNNSIDYRWGYHCQCLSGYVGVHCQWDSLICNADTTTPCQNGGSCLVTFNGRFCTCPGITQLSIAYGGYYCEIEKPCNSCPDQTAVCQTAQTVYSGRLCLDDGMMVISC